MFRRSALSLLLLVAGLAVTGAACGGGGSRAPTPRRAPPARVGGDSDAQASSRRFARTSATSGRRRSASSSRATISGSPKDPTLGAFLDEADLAHARRPRRLEGEEVGSDVRARRRADQGRRRVPSGRRRLVRSRSTASGTRLPAGSLTSDGLVRRLDDDRPASSVDPAGDPRCLRRPEEAASRTRSSRAREDVDGIKSDHVQGDIDLAALVKGIAAVAKTSGSAHAASPVSPAQIASGVQSLQQYVKSATADLWVGQDDKQLHRFATTIDGKTDDSTKASSGIDGIQHHARRVRHADVHAVGLGSRRTRLRSRSCSRTSVASSAVSPQRGRTASRI